MKAILTLLVLCGSLSCVAQTPYEQARAGMAAGDTIKLPVDPATKLITYSSVVAMPGLTQSEIYARGKIWFANTFRSGKDVVMSEEKDTGIIHGTSSETIYTTYALSVNTSKLWYSVKLTAKDGRYKYDISRFLIEATPTINDQHPEAIAVERTLLATETAPRWRATVRQQRVRVHDLATKLSAGIKNDMSKPAAGASAGKSDW